MPADRDVTLLWLRRELRLADNPALRKGAERARGGRLLPLAVWPDGQPDTAGAAPGGAARWWLWHSLASLAADLERRGSRLALVSGEPVAAVASLAAASGATAVVWTRGRTPGERDDDGRLAAALRAAGVAPVVVPGSDLLHDPDRLLTRDGRPFRVFTPFWRRLAGTAATAAGVTPAGEPLPAPRRLPPAPPSLPGEASLSSLRDAAVRPWASGFAAWRPGERRALAALADFVAGPLADYAAARERPDRDGTSRLSPHLHWGEVSARQVWAAVSGALAERGLEPDLAPGPAAGAAPASPATSAGAFLRQLAWREFAHHLLHHFPATPTEPLDRRFRAFPWRDDADDLAAWQRGETGYPLVDAAMRCLWASGWLHNRLRLVAASFLVKDLLLPWQAGAAWFLDTLVDADLADNTLGWQWVAGCGADAAPYFRVFNPVAQGRRHDPEGAFIARWLPELAGLPPRWRHEPWRAPQAVLAAAGVRLGDTYPLPRVDHDEARARALAAWRTLRLAG